MKVKVNQEQIDKLKSLIDRHGIDSLGVEPYKLIEMGVVDYYGGNLTLRGTPIKSLGNLESVSGYLDLYNTQIEDLGNLKSVRGYLFLAGTPLGKKLKESGMSKYEIKNKYGVKGDLFI
jgi:hypothetical protein